MKGMVQMTVKKTWVSVGEKETLMELVKRCENKEFVKFIKERPMECFPIQYFEHFCWIKYRFDDLKFDFENGNDPLANTKTYFNGISQDHFDDEEECLDFGSYNLSTGCDEGEEQIGWMGGEDDKPKFTPSETTKEKTFYKDLEIVINNYEELIPAMRCLLWSMNNEPQTTKKIYSYIKLNDNGNIRSLDRNDYEIINPIIRDAPKNGFLDLEKPSKDVFLYKNYSDTRQGYFYQGKLRSLSELVKMSGIVRSTLHKRLLKMNADKALQK